MCAANISLCLDYTLLFYCFLEICQSERMALYNAPRVAAVVGFEQEHCEFREYTVFERKLKGMTVKDCQINLSGLVSPLAIKQLQASKKGSGVSLNKNLCNMEPV